MKDRIDLIGRVLISFIFLFDAYDSIAFFKDTKALMISYGITWQPEMLLYSAIFLLIIGGTLVLIGYRSNFGATLLLLYWIPVTFVLHSWWDDPVEIRRISSIQFMKNIAIAGGLLIILVNGSGRYS
ncbi:MAG: DoxX family protein, partial [Saprospiraceae bacterium]|nr:DoxX family protein [Saprospiraceae bacterium]